MDIDASSADEEDGERGKGENEKTGEERERERAAIRKKLKVSRAGRRNSMSGTFLIVRGSPNAALGFTIRPVLVTVGAVNCLNFAIRISNARAGHSKWGKDSNMLSKTPPAGKPTHFLGLELATKQLCAVVADEQLDLVAAEAVYFDTDLSEYQTHGSILMILRTFHVVCSQWAPLCGRYQTIAYEL
ncbi:hypothetical protein JB92DRAFT_3141501 [Gautieria morchelliformis]|nr:hypothetical protein JB92DRAFT_3141501 [Gautieria morchelliformis]